MTANATLPDSALAGGSRISMAELLEGETTAARVRAALNMLLEAPYLYKDDDKDIFAFILRHKRELGRFFETHFGWQLATDSKCARLYKPQWYNERITPPNRDCFNFTRRDECIAFMLLLEFFEKRLEEESMSVDDPDNLRFRFGELLEYQRRRFRETFPDAVDNYGDDDIRRILRGVMPSLERYRFLRRIKPPDGETVAGDELIYEALPALWHYKAERVARPIDSLAAEEPDPEPDDE